MNKYPYDQENTNRRDAFSRQVRIELARQAAGPCGNGEPILHAEPDNFHAIGMLPGDARACLNKPECLPDIFGLLTGKPHDPQGGLLFRTVCADAHWLGIVAAPTAARERFFDLAMKAEVSVVSGGRGLWLLAPEDKGTDFLTRYASPYFRSLMDIPGGKFFVVTAESSWFQPVFGPEDGCPWYPVINMALTAVFTLYRAVENKMVMANDEGEKNRSGFAHEMEALLESWARGVSRDISRGTAAFRTGGARRRAAVADMVLPLASEILALTISPELLASDGMRRHLINFVLAKAKESPNLAAWIDEGGSWTTPDCAAERTMNCRPEDDRLLAGLLRSRGLRLPKRQAIAVRENFFIQKESTFEELPRLPAGRSEGILAVGIAMDEETRLCMIEEVLSGKLTALEASARYGVALNTVYRWLRRDPRWMARHGYRRELAAMEADTGMDKTEKKEDTHENDMSGNE